MDGTGVLTNEDRENLIVEVVDELKILLDEYKDIHESFDFNGTKIRDIMDICCSSVDRQGLDSKKPSGAWLKVAPPDVLLESPLRTLFIYDNDFIFLYFITQMDEGKNETFVGHRGTNWNNKKFVLAFPSFFELVKEFFYLATGEPFTEEDFSKLVLSFFTKRAIKIKADVHDRFFRQELPDNREGVFLGKLLVMVSRNHNDNKKTREQNVDGFRFFQFLKATNSPVDFVIGQCTKFHERILRMINSNNKFETTISEDGRQYIETLTDQKRVPTIDRMESAETMVKMKSEIFPNMNIHYVGMPPGEGVPPDEEVPDDRNESRIENGDEMDTDEEDDPHALAAWRRERRNKSLEKNAATLFQSLWRSYLRRDDRVDLLYQRHKRTTNAATNAASKIQDDTLPPLNNIELVDDNLSDNESGLELSFGLENASNVDNEDDQGGEPDVMNNYSPSLSPPPSPPSSLSSSPPPSPPSSPSSHISSVLAVLTAGMTAGVPDRLPDRLSKQLHPGTRLSEQLYPGTWHAAVVGDVVHDDTSNNTICDDDTSSIHTTSSRASSTVSDVRRRIEPIISSSETPPTPPRVHVPASSRDSAGGGDGMDGVGFGDGGGSLALSLSSYDGNNNDNTSEAIEEKFPNVDNVPVRAVVVGGEGGDGRGGRSFGTTILLSNSNSGDDTQDLLDDGRPIQEDTARDDDTSSVHIASSRASSTVSDVRRRVEQNSSSSETPTTLSGVQNASRQSVGAIVASGGVVVSPREGIVCKPLFFVDGDSSGAATTVCATTIETNNLANLSSIWGNQSQYQAAFNFVDGAAPPANLSVMSMDSQPVSVTTPRTPVAATQVHYRSTAFSSPPSLTPLPPIRSWWSFWIHLGDDDAVNDNNYHHAQS